MGLRTHAHVHLRVCVLAITCAHVSIARGSMWLCTCAHSTLSAGTQQLRVEEEHRHEPINISTDLFMSHRRVCGHMYYSRAEDERGASRAAEEALVAQLNSELA